MLLTISLLGDLMFPKELNEVDVIPLPTIIEFNSFDFNSELFTEEYIDGMKEEIRILEIKEDIKKQKVAEDKRISSVTFDPYNLSKPSNLTKEEMYELLKDTGLKDVAHTYIEAEKEYGVNAFFLAGLSALESGWGTSNLSINHNNLTGYNIRELGDKFSFSSRSESLMATAKLISEDYLNPNGRYFKGGDVWDINEEYCPPVPGEDVSWADKIVSISNKLLEDYKSLITK